MSRDVSKDDIDRSKKLRKMLKDKVVAPVTKAVGQPVKTKKSRTPVGKTPAAKLTGTPTGQTKKKEKKEKVVVNKKTTVVKTKKKKKSSSNSDEEDEDDDDDDGEDECDFTGIQANQELYMAGALRINPPNPTNYVRRILKIERPDLMGQDLTDNDCLILDAYLRAKGEIRDQEWVIMRELGDEDEKHKDRLSVVKKYNEGRFSAIYVVQRVESVDKKIVFSSNMVFIMKTSLRQSAVSTTRLQREIAALKVINDVGKSKVSTCKRVIQLLFASSVLGIPYFIMPPMDVSLEKIRQELSGKMCSACAFYIGSEILLGLKDVHCKKLVHRDIKPTNVLSHPKQRLQFFLIDFGDAIIEGNRSILSPPDGLTLPYMSILAHQSAKDLTPATQAMDLESWFYVLLELFSPLPWKTITEENEVIKAKTEFWENIDTFLINYPPPMMQIAKLTERGPKFPYSAMFQLLKEGFDKQKTADWKACWVEKRIVVKPPGVQKVKVETVKK